MLPSSTSSRPFRAVALIRKRRPRRSRSLSPRNVPGGDLEPPTVQVARIEERRLDRRAVGDREQRTSGGIRRRRRRGAEEDAVGDAVQDRVEPETLAFAEGPLGDRREPRERLQELRGDAGVVVCERFVPEGVDGAIPSAVTRGTRTTKAIVASAPSGPVSRPSTRGSPE